MTLTLTFNPLRAMFMAYSQAKDQGQRSVSSKAKVDTNGRTEATALPYTNERR